MACERITENIVRKHFTKFIDDNIIFEEQISSNLRINKLLKNASKQGDGKGFPEFIISFSNLNDLLIVIECKSSILKHRSKNGNDYKNYAVDGAKLYSSYLSKEYDVLSIAVSGKTEQELKVSHFLQIKGKSEISEVFGNSLLPLENYLLGYKQSELKFKQTYSELLKYSKKLNDLLHTNKIQESDRSLLISGILIALEDEAFRISYQKQTNQKILAENLVSTIRQQLSLSITGDKAEILIHQYRFIEIHPILSKTFGNSSNILRNLIAEIDENINSFMKTYKYHDVLGQFYVEFLRYANNDKGLGIVLTPPHITELFAELAFVNKDSVVIDNCTGTGGFLISSMQKMIEKANGDEEKIKIIQKNQLIGIEQQPNIFTLACSNMYIHGDGKSNVIYGNCFEQDSNRIKKNFAPTIGMLNPPYKSNKNDIEEFEFIINNLSFLTPGGYCVAIIPISCALAQNGNRLELKKRILENHTLEAVISMPDELFINSKVGVITCIVVFKAHQPHPDNYTTFFGYWKDDGFIKRKTTGRSDYLNRWNDIKKEWINGYTGKKTVVGLSVLKNVCAEDEWCAEAYMSTDYSKLNVEMFIHELISLSTYFFLNKIKKSVDDSSFSSIETISLDTSNWEFIKIGKLFKVEKGREQASEDGVNTGNIPLVSATRNNNGVTGLVSEGKKKFPGNSISVPSNGASTGEAFYQAEMFFATGDVNILIPLFNLNKYIAIFLVTIIRMEKYRFSYGRKWGATRMSESEIKVPMNKLSNEVDFIFMEKFIKTLPYSNSI